MKPAGAIPRLVVLSVLVVGRLWAADIRVGIYQPDAKKSHRGVYLALQSTKGIEVSFLPAVNGDSLADVDVLVLPQVGGPAIEAITEPLRAWVAQGGGLMALHDAVGYRRHPAVFPQIARGVGNPYDRDTGYGSECIVAREHPITEGLKVGEIVKHTYYDQVVMEPGAGAEVIAREAVVLDEDNAATGGPAIIASPVGKGKYVANGLLIGYGPVVGEVVPKGGEYRLFINAIRWLASAETYTAGEDAGRGVKVARAPEEKAETGIDVEDILESAIDRHQADWQASKREEAPAVVESNFEAPIAFDEKVLAGSGYTGTPEGWTTIDLAGAWKIKKLADTEKNPADDEGTKEGYYRVDYDDGEWPERSVPSSWDTKDVLPDMEGDVGVGHRSTHFIGVGWYRRKVGLPEDARGKRVVLRFEGCDFETRAWVNGKPVGRHVGGRTPFEFDCTEAMEVGNENTIAVRVYDVDQMTGLEYYPGRDYGRSMYSHDGGWRLIGGIWGETYLSLRPPVHAVRTLITPHLASSEIEVDCWLNNTGKARGVALTAKILPAPPPLAKGEGSQAEVSLGKIRLPSGISKHSFRVKLDNPVLWSPDNPYLYLLQLTDGRETLAQERFGFREFKAEGRYFVLNGKRIYLRSASVSATTFYMKPRIEVRDEAKFLTRYLLGAKAYNCNMIYTATGPHARQVYDLCDELGLLVYYEWAAVGSVFSNPLMEEGWNKDETEIAVWVYGGYNHPSIAMFSLGAELMEGKPPKPHTGYGALLNPAYDLVKSIDKHGRPVCASSGRRSWTRAEDKTDINDLHFYACGINRSWTDQTAGMKAVWKYALAIRKNEKPVISFELPGHRWSNRDLPALTALLEDENKTGKMDREQFIALLEKEPVNYEGARWISNLYGVRRYQDDIGGERGWREYAGYQIYCQKNVIEEIRRAGPLMQGYRPNAVSFDLTEVMEDGKLFPGVSYGGGRTRGDLAKKVYVETEAHQAFKRVNNPKFVCLDVFDKNVFAGGELKFQVYAINDIDELSKDWRVRVVVKSDDGPVLEDKEAGIGNVEGFRRKLMSYAYSVPVDAGTGFYRIELFLYEGGAIVSDNHYDFFVLGKADLPTEMPTTEKVALYDTRDTLYKEGIRTRTILEGLAIPHDLLKSFDGLDGYDVLIIGADSLDKTVVAAGDEIKAWIERGGTALQFEQHIGGPVPYWRKLRVLPGKGHIITEIVELNHPVFKGLHYRNMERWNSLPRSGTPGEIFRLTLGPLDESVLATGSSGIQPRQSTKSTRMILSEVEIGKGKLLMTQAEATQRYGQDPVATKLIQNLLAYVLEGGEGIEDWGKKRERAEGG